MKQAIKNNNTTTQSISRNKLLGVAGVGWMFDAMDVGILSFVIAALSVDWGLNSTEMGWIGSVNSNQRIVFITCIQLTINLGAVGFARKML